MIGLCVASLACSAGAILKVNAAAPVTTVAPGQPVDLTYAAEKALPAVVHIRYVQNSKVKTVEVQSDPFSDFLVTRLVSLAIPVMVVPKSVKCKLQSAKLLVLESSYPQMVTS